MSYLTDNSLSDAAHAKLLERHYDDLEHFIPDTAISKYKEIMERNNWPINDKYMKALVDFNDIKQEYFRNSLEFIF